MHCHYIYTEDGLKVLIPGCMAVAISGDIRDCICNKKVTFERLERESYNQQLKKLCEEIEDLREENSHLMGVIESMKKRNHKRK